MQYIHIYKIKRKYSVNNPILVSPNLPSNKRKFITIAI